MHQEQAKPDTKAHWDGVYARSAQNGVGWYRPHLETSLRLIQSVAGCNASILDVGGGHSTLVDDLLEQGYTDLTVLDVSAEGLAKVQERLGQKAEAVTWRVGDVTDVNLPAARYDLWHDRAVFHFLLDAQMREDYVHQATHALKPGGHLVIATFGPQGPMKCSGLPVCRYDADSLSAIFGPRFRLIESCLEIHQTPSGNQQQFLYCCMQFQ